MDSERKRLLVRSLILLSETSGLFPESLTLPNVIPEYGQRASGGFAYVYKGKCFGEDIAIKAFRMPLLSHVNSLDSGGMFEYQLRELITWRQLSHPNVLPFYGVYFLQDALETRFCLVSPWMENGNVVEFLARQHREDPYGDTTNCVCLVRNSTKSGGGFVIMVNLSRRSILHLAFNIFMPRKSSTGISKECVEITFNIA